LSGYKIGDRVFVGITPCGQCRLFIRARLNAVMAKGSKHGLAIRQHYQRRAGEYLLVAQANLAADERQTNKWCYRGHRFDRTARNRRAFASGIRLRLRRVHRLCATAGANHGRFLHHRRRKRSRSNGNVETNGARRADPTQCDVVTEIKKVTGGGGWQSALGTGDIRKLSALPASGRDVERLGVYSGKLQVVRRFRCWLGDYKIVTTLCPGGKERMRRLMSMVQSKRFDPLPLLTHRFKLDQIVEAYDLFASRREGVLKVAITP
jgi:threonine dehydrogenase-like Zn-dependent dehydrogenase